MASRTQVTEKRRATRKLNAGRLCRGESAKRCVPDDVPATRRERARQNREQSSPVAQPGLRGGE